MDLLSRIKEFCLAQGFEHTYWLGYSGGLDSHVLLHILVQLRQLYPLKLHAVYVNHGLSLKASQWEKHCENICRQYAVDFSTYSISVPNKNLEELARKYRYAVFTERLNSGDILLTAHHQDDQAETVLLQLLRGAGPKGLSAMPRLKPLGKGFHARPLLDVSREELMRYAQARTLNWIEDESNSNTHYMRNFLRHDILSRLKTRLPTITKTLARVADNCAQVQELLRVTAKQHLQNMLGSSPQQLFVPALLKHDALQQSAILRTWFEELNYPIPSAVKLQQIQQSFLSIRQDTVPHIHWGNVELRRYRDYLYIMPCLVSHDKYRTYEWDLSQSLNLPAIGALQATSQQGQGLRLDIQKVLVRFRQGGEMIQLPGRSHRHEVKKLFQAWGIPSWQRDRIPFIFVGDQLAAIVGWAVDAMFVAEKNAWGQALTLQPFL